MENWRGIVIIAPGLTFLQVYEQGTTSVQSLLGLRYIETIFVQYMNDEVD